MRNFDYLFQSITYQDEVSVLIGLHDGRLIEGSCIEVKESLILRLNFIGQAYNLHLTSLIHTHEDIALNYTQCQNLVEELDFIRSIVSDPLLEIAILKITEIAQVVIKKENRRISLYISGN